VSRHTEEGSQFEVYLGNFLKVVICSGGFINLTPLCVGVIGDKSDTSQFLEEVHPKQESNIQGARTVTSASSLPTEE